MVERFWQEESVESCSIYTEEQMHCEALFKSTTRQLQDGRFMVKLPFKANGERRLGNSLEIAKARFSYLERRLNKNAELKEQYSQFLLEYLQAGHMELISLSDIPSWHYFLPHQCVLRPDSSTTKLRVVFDESCRTSSNTSLNDILMVGTIVQDDLLAIILRFRCYKYALTADISAMYRQILVYPEDRNYQLILWRENLAAEFKIYRLRTVTYGTASAPFLATRCLIELANNISSTKSTISQIIRKDFYMDDLVTGANSKSELRYIKNEVDASLKSAQLHLRKWYSNDTDLLDEIPENDKEKVLRINDSDIIKTLGVIWEPRQDKFGFYYRKNITTSSRITKRTVLSEIASLFDPLGLVNPVVSKAKIFLQELWNLKLDWDESLPMEIETRWRLFSNELSQLQKIEVPRLVLFTEAVKSIELHGFCDASIRAYGCCIYVRSVNIEGDINVKLLAAKSKVAPIRTARSLPCLELCGALLLSRLLDKIQKSLSITVDDVILWTDSEIVLDWLSSHPSSWKTFVANRVSEIQRLTSGTRWRHVNSENNPADIISRGASVLEILQSYWFCGPAFLLKSSKFWPPTKARHLNMDLPERRQIKSILICCVGEDFLQFIYGSSDFMFNCRRFAWVLRFWNNLKLKSAKQDIRTGDLSADEIDTAFLRIVWCIQQKEFIDEIQCLERNQELRSGNYIKLLAPFLKEKLLRVGGRLRHSDKPYDMKHPILLPKDNAFVNSYVRYLHLKNFHAGPLALVTIIRQRVWPINAKEYARKCVRRCFHCFKYKPKLMQQIMGDLPKSRVRLELPFSHTGVDFCGPFQTTHRIRGKSTYKSYVAVFVCFRTKAVHIEVVSDLSSAAFIAALKRFVGRRNLCKDIYCDNATNFVGARRLLKEFRAAFFMQQSQHEIGNWCATNNIRFHHIPPRSPHFGGIWEAAIKSAKSLLFKTFQGSLLTFEELTTAMVQIEAVLNSRPITPLSSDPSDMQALTPAHFLMQAPIEVFFEPNLTKEKASYLRRWQLVTALFQHFWSRWTKEYLCFLQERSKWKSTHTNITTNTLVLVHDNDLPPTKWKLGRIVQVTKGADNHVRVVGFQVGDKIIQRSIHKIAPLPVDES